ncbi:type I 3-dehydroquinate dehydratase [Candidatus Methanocrinis natronophilus]|uniref:3-dehydroquinate dehydratase n=1 Tax=Candidatus Methanocrinis natronophilus TaxID=3033396 RepID=A0ABT5X8A3_9EURY|nr:type I 3-dehydroquinate dehydratase [Candidatus Methanocrinis natronophilus]MDF0590934.1 type I 3-dehydroquinate dehydratase [Candidatus Methanocrinis natronophilus]
MVETGEPELEGKGDERSGGRRSYRTLLLDGLRIEAPAVVAVLSGPAAERDASAAEGLGADLVEVRLDLVPGDPIGVIRRVREATQLPIIATNRIAEEGGAFRGGEGERIQILAEASAWADLVDVELLAGGRDRLMEAVGRPLIISYHDFGGMPSLEGTRSILAEIFDAGADIAKVALTPPTLKDCLGLLQLVHETERPLSLMGMGDLGKHLRAVAPVYGSVLTYGHIGAATAPGQIPVKALRELLDALLAEGR